MNDFTALSAACDKRGQVQEYLTKKQMWDDIQLLKEAVSFLQSQINELRRRTGERI